MPKTHCLWETCGMCGRYTKEVCGYCDSFVCGFCICGTCDRDRYCISTSPTHDASSCSECREEQQYRDEQYAEQEYFSRPSAMEGGYYD